MGANASAENADGPTSVQAQPNNSAEQSVREPPVAQDANTAPTTNWQFQGQPVGGDGGLRFNQEFNMGNRRYMLSSDPAGPRPPTSEETAAGTTADDPQLQMQRKTSLRSDVNIRKHTLALQQVEGQERTFGVSFTFDSICDCTVTVYWLAREVPSDTPDFPRFSTKLVNKTVKAHKFGPGLEQKFVLPDEEALCIDGLEEDDYIWKPKAPRVPIVIVVQSFPPGYECSGTLEECSVLVPSTERRPQAQMTLASFKHDDDRWAIVPVGQRLVADGVAYVLQEIFGIENTNTDETERDCVVCLCASRSIVLLPCRHMCLCGECANMLRFKSPKCPICRQPVLSMLEIRVAPLSDEVGDASEVVQENEDA